MPPRVRIRTPQPRRHALNVSPLTLRATPFISIPHRQYASDQKSSGPNMDQLPHINEEKAAVNKTMDRKDGLSAEDMGTPVHEVVKDDPEAKENMPKVVRDEIDAGKKPAPPRTDPSKSTSGDGKRGFATMARPGQRRAFSTVVQRSAPADTYQPKDPVHINRPSPEQSFGFSDAGVQQRMRELGHSAGDINALAAGLRNVSLDPEPSVEDTLPETLPEGLKFPLPEEELTRRDNMKYRYDDVVQQFTNLIMKDGRKSRAQTFTSQALSYLRASPPPQPKARISPLNHSPIPASALPLNPTAYLTLALDSLGPALRMQSLKGAAGGGRALPVPAPINMRQRRRAATLWLLETVEKRRYRSIGGFGRRLGEEIVAVVEGRSSAWEKRATLHRSGVMSRANIGTNKKPNKQPKKKKK